MAYYAAILKMLDPIKNKEFRPQHLQHIQEYSAQGKIFACGPFPDGAGGLIVYVADSYEEAEVLAKKDPYVMEGVRELHLHEWNMSLPAASL